MPTNPLPHSKARQHAKSASPFDQSHFLRQSNPFVAVAHSIHRKPLLQTRSHHPPTKRYRADGLPHCPRQGKCFVAATLDLHGRPLRSHGTLQPLQSATALMAHLTTLARVNASAQILSRLTTMPLFPTRSHHPCTKRYRADGPPHYPCQGESPPPASFRCHIHHAKPNQRPRISKSTTDLLSDVAEHRKPQRTPCI